MRIVQAILWWMVLIFTLIILDDLLFGPLFWALSLVSKLLATYLAFLISFCFQLWLVREAMRDHKSNSAEWFLSRLFVERSSTDIAVREESLKRNVTSFMGAAFATLLLGGVITSLLLLRQQNPKNKMKAVAIPMALCFIYSIEFSLVHGGWGIGEVVRKVVL